MAVQCAGLDLDGDLDDGDAPLEALLVVKVLAADGGADWKVMATRGLHSVEAIGAAHFAAAMLTSRALGDDD